MSSIESLLNELSESPEERETMGFALRLLAWAPAPLDLPFGLRERIEAAVHQPAGASFTQGGAAFARASHVEWVKLAEGVTCKALHASEETGERALLVRMDPNCPLPPVTLEPEQLYVLDGELWAGQVQMRAGDYRQQMTAAAPPELRSGRAGALFFVVTGQANGPRANEGAACE